MIKSKSGRLMIVDDEIDLLTSLCDILSEIGYETVGFTSGKDALKALKEQDFDLLLTDLMMPEMDGIALLRAALEMRQTAAEGRPWSLADYLEIVRALPHWVSPSTRASVNLPDPDTRLV